MGFGLGLAALERKTTPAETEQREAAADRAADAAVKKEQTAAADQQQPPPLFRAVTAPEPERTAAALLSTRAESPSASHRGLSVAIPGSSPPPAAASAQSPQLSSPLSAEKPTAFPSPFPSPFPSGLSRSAYATPPSHSSSLSPSPPTSPPLSPSLRLSELLDDEAAAAAGSGGGVKAAGAVKAEQDAEGEKEAEAVVPPQLLQMSKHSLLAAIQKLDEQINDGEEERDALLQTTRELRQRAEQIRLKAERMGGVREGELMRQDDEDDDSEAEDEEERLRLEQEQRARSREEEASRREEQHAFEHFSLADSSEPGLSLSARIYAANQTRADRAHRHFDRLYPAALASAFRQQAAQAASLPRLERPGGEQQLQALSFTASAADREALGLPLYAEVSECGLYRLNLQRFPVCRQRVAAVLARRRRKTYGKLRRLASQYLQAEKRWRQEEEAREARRRAQPPLPRLSRTNAHLLTEAGYGFGFDPGSSGGGGQTAEQRRAKWSKGVAALPPMIIDESDRRHSVFLSRNGLIEDCKEEERQYKLSSPWTERERAVFQRRYLQYPKAFRKIAACLPSKSVNDCVSYYYYSKLSIDYKQLLREQQKRQRERKSRRRQDGAAAQPGDDDDGDEEDEEAEAMEAAGAGGEAVTATAAAAPGRKKERGAAAAAAGAGRLKEKAKPRGMSRELIGLAIDLSNLGGRSREREGRERGRDRDRDSDSRARRKDGDDEGEEEEEEEAQQDSEQQRGQQEDEGEEQEPEEKDDDEEEEERKDAKDGAGMEVEQEERKEADEREARRDDERRREHGGGAGGDGEGDDGAVSRKRRRSAVPASSSLPANLDLYDDDDDKAAAGEQQRQLQQGQQAEAEDDEEQQLVHRADASAVEGETAPASPQARRRRRLSRRSLPQAQPSQSQTAGDRRKQQRDVAVAVGDAKDERRVVAAAASGDSESESADEDKTAAVGDSDKVRLPTPTRGQTQTQPPLPGPTPSSSSSPPCPSRALMIRFSIEQLRTAVWRSIDMHHHLSADRPPQPRLCPPHSLTPPALSLSLSRCRRRSAAAPRLAAPLALWTRPRLAIVRQLRRTAGLRSCTGLSRRRTACCPLCLSTGATGPHWPPPCPAARSSRSRPGGRTTGSSSG